MNLYYIYRHAFRILQACISATYFEKYFDTLLKQVLVSYCGAISEAVVEGDSEAMV